MSCIVFNVHASHLASLQAFTSKVFNCLWHSKFFWLFNLSVNQEHLWGCRGICSANLLIMSVFLPTFFPKSSLTQPVPPFKIQCNTLIIRLSLPAQYTGFRQLSESNNRLRQSGGTGWACLCVFNQPPGCSFFISFFIGDQWKNPAFNCWGGP